MPKIVDKEQKKREIALLALDVFVDQGFEAASISRIAEVAGIGKGTVYEYFDSKEELFSAAIVVCVEQMVEAAKTVLEGVDDPVERLRRLVHASMEPFISDERTLKLTIAMFQVMLTGGKLDPHGNLIREMFRGFRQTLVEILLDGVSRGVFRPEIAKDAEKIAINLTAYLDGIGLHYYMSDGYFDLREQIEFHLEHLIPSLRASS